MAREEIGQSIQIFLIKMVKCIQGICVVYNCSYTIFFIIPQRCASLVLIAFVWDISNCWLFLGRRRSGILVHRLSKDIKKLIIFFIFLMCAPPENLVKVKELLYIIWFIYFSSCYWPYMLLLQVLLIGRTFPTIAIVKNWLWN